MPTVDTLLPRIEEYCRATGTAESTFGRIAVNDGKLVRRLRAGGSITLRTLQRIEGVLSAAPSRGSAADRIVGARIRLRRELVGLSQARLAATLDVSLQQMSEFEQGAARVGAARLCAIARALEAPISFFFAELSPTEIARPEIGPSPGLPATPAAAELLSAYARIGNSRLRRAVLAVARSLAREAPRSECRSRENSRSSEPCSSKSRAH
jgi:transcriptional regulator with XRE-family HTH domain